MSKVVWIINQYASTPDTGLGGRHYYLARELSGQGVKVYVVSASYNHILRNAPFLDKNYQIETHNGFNYVWLKMPKYLHAHSKGRIRNWFLFAFRILQLDQHIPDKPDAILYSSPSLVGFLGAERLAKKLHCTLAFEVRDIWPLTFCEIGGFSPRHPFIRFLQWVEDRAYRVSEVVVSNLVNSVEHMVSRGMDRAKFSWVPNGYLQEEVDNPVPLDAEIQKRIPGDKFVVGYAGTLGVANSLYYFLDAAKRFESSRVEFVLAGIGKEKDALLKYVEDNGIENVTFLGSVPKSQVQSLLQSFDACYLGLSNDPLFRFGVSPNKLFDYFSASRPIVYAIDSGDYRPVQDAGAGLHIPPEDSEAIFKAVATLMKLSKEERLKMGENGRVFAQRNHEYQALAKKMYLSLFENTNA